MKEIEVFYLTYCPYCINARKAIGELMEEDPSYRTIEVRWIDESREKVLADSRDYYYVPSIYWNGRKLYEARPGHSYARIKENFRKAFDTVIAGHGA